MAEKTILLIDDEQIFLEALADALHFEKYRVLKARSGEEGLKILAREHVDLVTIDIMLDPGESLKNNTDSHHTGIFLCKEIKNKYPDIHAFCISVISDMNTIKYIQSLGVHFIKKGETPLRKVVDLIRSKLSGIAYSSGRVHKQFKNK